MGWKIIVKCNNKLVNYGENACAVFNAFLKNTFVERSEKWLDNGFIIKTEFSSYKQLALAEVSSRAS